MVNIRRKNTRDYGHDIHWDLDTNEKTKVWNRRNNIGR